MAWNAGNIPLPPTGNGGGLLALGRNATGENGTGQGRLSSNTQQPPMNQVQITQASDVVFGQLRELAQLHRSTSNTEAAGFTIRLGEVVEHIQHYGLQRYNLAVSQDDIRALVMQYIATSLRDSPANIQQVLAERARFRLFEVNLHNAVGSIHSLSDLPEIQDQIATVESRIHGLTTAVEAVLDTALDPATTDDIENQIDTLCERQEAIKARLNTALRSQQLMARVVRQAMANQRPTAAELAELDNIADMTI